MINTIQNKLNTDVSKSIEIPKNITFKLVANNNNKYFLLIKGRYYVEKAYVCIPSSVTFYRKENFINFQSKVIEPETVHSFKSFIFKIYSAIKSVRKKFKKVVVLKGMGLKINYNRSLDKLELKLGYSHLVNVNLNIAKKSIFLKNIKNTLIVWGGKTQVGNFIDKLKRLKKQSAYKEKGFFFLDSKITLKKIKKA